MSRRAALPLLLGLVLLVSGAPPDATADESPAVDGAARTKAIDRGLSYLAKTLPRLPDTAGTPRRPFVRAATGYVLLLAGDRTGVRRSKRNVLIADLKDQTIRYLEEVESRSRRTEDLPSRQGVAESWALIQYTWPCAVASLFFAEMHARDLYRDEAADAVTRLVSVLGEAQQENGGWGHGRAKAEGSYPNTLLASSALVAGAMGTVHRTLLLPTPDMLGRARTYFEDAQLRNGNFPYDPSQRSADFDPLGAGRVAGAVWALHALGMPLRDRTIRRSLKYLDAHPAQVAEGHGSAALTLLFGALAAKVRGEKAWSAFKERFFGPMIEAQRKDGAFVCIAKGDNPGTTNDSKPKGGMASTVLGATSDAYVTAIHTWILLLDAETPKTMAPPTATTPTEDD